MLIRMLIYLARCQSTEASAVEYEVAGDGVTPLHQFYADAFGWTTDPLFPRHDMAVRHGRRVVEGTMTAARLVRLALADHPDVEDLRPTDIAFLVGVDDIEAALDTIVGLGGRTVFGPIRTPGGEGVALFADTHGLLLGLSKAHG